MVPRKKPQQSHPFTHTVPPQQPGHSLSQSLTGFTHALSARNNSNHHDNNNTHNNNTGNSTHTLNAHTNINHHDNNNTHNDNSGSFTHTLNDHNNINHHDNNNTHNNNTGSFTHTLNDHNNINHHDNNNTHNNNTGSFTHTLNARNNSKRRRSEDRPTLNNQKSDEGEAVKRYKGTRSQHPTLQEPRDGPRASHHTNFDFEQPEYNEYSPIEYLLDAARMARHGVGFFEERTVHYSSGRHQVTSQGRVRGPNEQGIGFRRLLSFFAPASAGPIASSDTSANKMMRHYDVRWPDAGGVEYVKLESIHGIGREIGPAITGEDPFNYGAATRVANLVMTTFEKALARMGDQRSQFQIVTVYYADERAPIVHGARTDIYHGDSSTPIVTMVYSGYQTYETRDVLENTREKIAQHLLKALSSSSAVETLTFAPSMPGVTGPDPWEQGASPLTGKNKNNNNNKNNKNNNNNNNNNNTFTN